MTYAQLHASMAAAMTGIINPAEPQLPVADSRHGADNPETVMLDDAVTTTEALRLYEQAGTPLRNARSSAIAKAAGSRPAKASTTMAWCTTSSPAPRSTPTSPGCATIPPTRLPPRPPAFNATRFHDRTKAHQSFNNHELTAANGRSSMVIAQLQHQVQQSDAERLLLRDQLAKKDGQIGALNAQADANTRTISTLNGIIEKLARYFPNT